MPDTPAGTLFLVATPIGNLEDISIRALRVLREVGLVAAEDTRHTAKLLHHYGIRTPMTSVHEHNERVRAAGLIDRLLGGESVALVSDAGTPTVSDPGYGVVRAALGAGVRVEAIPGASAVMVALSCSGLPTDSFVFLGFPPPRSAARRRWFEGLRFEPRTMVLFEAPHRIRACLMTAGDVLGPREVAVGRELTKIHETWVRGPLGDVLGHLAEPRGEYTVVVAGSGAAARTASPAEVPDSLVLASFEGQMAAGAGRREAVAAVARDLGWRSRDVYAAVERARRP